MNKLLVSTILSVSFIAACPTQVYAVETLDELLREREPLQTLQKIKADSFETYQKLCTEIQSQEFYDKAAKAGLGVFKRNEVARECEGKGKA